MSIKNPFQAKSANDVQNELERSAKIKVELEEIETIGKDLLADQRYDKYRIKLNELMNKALRAMLKYNHHDNDVYATNMKTLIAKINVLMAFLDQPVDFLNEVAKQRVSL